MSRAHALPIVTVVIATPQDVVAARQRIRQIASALGFGNQDQTRIATSVSEIARNALVYAGVGRMQVTVEGTETPQQLSICISDKGLGIADIDQILQGRYHSSTGMGLGILGAMRLMDDCHIETVRGKGTQVTLKKTIPLDAPVGKTQTADIAAMLASHPTEDAVSEVHRQNQELLRALEVLHKRQIELQTLSRELEDTNRGVVALYAELDEKADRLRHADEMKSRFLSNMSHEFRTPLSSIRALAGMLIDRIDGELTVEQDKQVRFIQKAADDLSELVNDLLDLAKIEAGKVEIHYGDFEIANVFSAMRGMLRPLLNSDKVALIFEVPLDLPVMCSDEAKVAQILRNFISNALKFTEQGEVRVCAELHAHAQEIAFSVKDSGIGIAPDDIETIFEEFTQIENPRQRHFKGTGLGLPLCQKLAMLLGGRIEVSSILGEGSIFSVILPVRRSAPQPSDLSLEAGTRQPDVIHRAGHVVDARNGQTQHSIQD